MIVHLAVKQAARISACKVSFKLLRHQIRRWQVTQNRFSGTTAPQVGLLLRHDENVGISKAMVNGLVPIFQRLKFAEVVCIQLKQIRKDR